MPGTAAAVHVRQAEFSDVPAITTIYNEGIEDGVATLETRRREIPEMEAWFRNRSPRHPVLVGEYRGRVIAWCSLNVFNYRTCYDGVADLSIYVARRYRGRGVGRVMLQQLLDTARELNYYKLVLATLAHNEVGVNLYQQFGFKEVGIYRQHGRIRDHWVDMRIMELFIGEK